MLGRLITVTLVSLPLVCAAAGILSVAHMRGDGPIESHLAFADVAQLSSIKTPGPAGRADCDAGEDCGAF
jgi:hypothetical protein